MSSHIAIPVVHPEVRALAPGFRALSVVAESVEGGVDPAAAGMALRAAAAAAAAGEPPWAEAHIEAWRQVFRRFGAKPQRTPSSADALRRRFLRDGSLPTVNAVVDLYNAVSLRFAVPVGGENLAAYIGAPRLVRATGNEAFDTVKEGEAVEEHPDAGEVVWRDDVGVTCRRWNWRQCVRTRLEPGAPTMWFILESLPEMPLDALHQAGAELAAGLRAMMPGAAVETTLIE